jgi:hypothetical protein
LVYLGRTFTRDGGKTMICPFCKQDVDAPCQNTVEMQQRASAHIDRCEMALKSLKGIVYG